MGIRGVRRWVRQFGSTSTDSAVGVGVDREGHVDVAGTTDGAIPGAGQAPAGGDDLFVGQWDADGSGTWLHTYGAPEADMTNGLAVDHATGDLYVTGYTLGALPGSRDENPNRAMTAFAASWNAAGERRWTRQVSSGTNDDGRGVGVDSSHNVNVVGTTEGQLPGSTDAHVPPGPDGGHGARVDVFTASWASDGSDRWVHQFGSPNTDLGEGIGASDGGLYVTGSSDGQLPGAPEPGLGAQWASVASISETSPPPAVVSEAPAAALLPVSGVIAFMIAMAIESRRRAGNALAGVARSGRRRNVPSEG